MLFMVWFSGTCIQHPAYWEYAEDTGSVIYYGKELAICGFLEHQFPRPLNSCVCQIVPRSVEPLASFPDLRAFLAPLNLPNAPPPRSQGATFYLAIDPF